MPRSRGKLKIQWIVENASRKATFRKRRATLLEKARELSILCNNIPVAVVVYGPGGNAEPAFWPLDQEEAKKIMKQYLDLPEASKVTHRLDNEGFLRQALKKMGKRFESYKASARRLEVNLILNDISLGRRSNLDDLPAELAAAVRSEVAVLRSFINERVNSLTSGAAAVVPQPLAPEEAPAEVLVSSKEAPLMVTPLAMAPPMVTNAPLFVPPPLEPELLLVPQQEPMMAPPQEPLMVAPLTIAPPVVATAPLFVLPPPPLEPEVLLVPPQEPLMAPQQEPPMVAPLAMAPPAVANAPLFVLPSPPLEPEVLLVPPQEPPMVAPLAMAPPVVANAPLFVLPPPPLEPEVLLVPPQEPLMVPQQGAPMVAPLAMALPMVANVPLFVQPPPPRPQETPMVPPFVTAPPMVADVPVLVPVPHTLLPSVGDPLAPVAGVGIEEHDGFPRNGSYLLEMADAILDDGSGRTVQATDEDVDRLLWEHGLESFIKPKPM